MKVIPREAGKITYSTKIRTLKGLSLNKKQKAVIVGSILGDGHLEPNWSKTNYRLKINNSVKQSEYVLWKYHILQSITLSSPRECLSNDSIGFRTISHREIFAYRFLFYNQNGKKIVPRRIAEYLNNRLAVAVWFMDDGNARLQGKIHRGYFLNTQSFSLQENRKLIVALRHLTGARFLLSKDHSYYRLYVGKKVDREKFAQYIKPYILPSLRYKLG